MARTKTEAESWLDTAVYDPATETEPLIRQHVILAPSGPALVGASGHAYPAWSVYLMYLICERDVARTSDEYLGDLTPDQILASVRFATRYPGIVDPYVKPHLVAVEKPAGREDTSGGGRGLS